MKKSTAGKISLKLIIALMIPLLAIIYLAANGPSYEEITSKQSSSTYK